MKQELALEILAKVMKWDTERARQEFAWLSLISRLKCDGYRDFVAGMRFIESLVGWLQQFDQSDRDAAYKFIRHELVYVGSTEMQHLVEQFYPETFCWRILLSVSSDIHIPVWQVYSNSKAMSKFKELQRRTLFVGLSDGAQIDTFRRANIGVVNNEQVVGTYQIDNDKWNSLLTDLRKETGDESAKFDFVFLIDDFIGSGLTLLREKDGKWKGKMVKFWDSIQLRLDGYFSENWTLCVHHYIGTHKAKLGIEKRNNKAKREKGGSWFKNVKFSFGISLPKYFPIDKNAESDINNIINRYYDPAIETRHTKVGGEDVRYGFAGCALPLVLEHNTPNNSIALIWAESKGSNNNHTMRPLFRRRQRHM